MPISEAEPPSTLYRVGRAPNPLAWPPANVIGRYNDPFQEFRVLYAALERRTAFLETLQVYRPALADLARLASDSDRAGGEPFALSLGVVPRDYFAKRIGAFRPESGQRWLDLRSVHTHAVLRGALAADLVAVGYTGEFSFGEIIGSGHSVTQRIARWAFEAGYGGIAYPSAHDSQLTCWAIFNRAPIIPVSPAQPILREDPDLLAALDLFGLRFHE